VRIDWTCRNAMPNSMIPKRNIATRGKISAISTAAAPR
jgi:hypothetical protein